MNFEEIEQQGETPLSTIIQILKETSNKFRSLDESANLALQSKNSEVFMQKRKEGAELIASLPKRLANLIEKISDSSKKQTVTEEINWMAEEAQKALESGNAFVLGAFLTEKGSGENYNYIDRLVASLKNS